MSSQAIWVPVTGGLGSLLVSLFNVKWRFSEPAGGVKASKFCLFSVIMPSKCVSSVSPRFHYRRLAFCFFLLAAILESPGILRFLVSFCKEAHCDFDRNCGESVDKFGEYSILTISVVPVYEIKIRIYLCLTLISFYNIL
jgi:hypothetical protein